MAASCAFFEKARFGLPTRARSSRWSLTISLMAACPATERIHHHLLGHLARSGFHHHDGLIRSSDDEVDLALGARDRSPWD